MTTTYTVNHPTNGNYNSEYLYALKNIKTGRIVVIFASYSTTQKSLRNAWYEAVPFIKTIAPQCKGSLVGKGRTAYIKIDGSDWIVQRIGTRREFHGKTIERL